ncbi:MAG: NADH:ubiquinone oxidoreductase [Dehalococcoidia bacterium]|nr:NADH:ubiquinone oxidoreductase [Dehalococcoidia bacterium]
MASKKARNTLVIVSLVFVTFLVFALARDISINGIHIYTLGATSPDLTTPTGFMVPVRIILEVDGIAILMGIIWSIVSLAAAIFSLSHIASETGQNRFYTLLLLMVTGGFGMMFTSDLFNLFVFLEIASISGAALIASRTRFADSQEGGFKYIVVSAIASLMILFAIGLLYAQYNLLNIGALAAAIQYTMLDRIALVILISAFVMKLGGVPMHMWLSDTYSVAPVSITVLLIAASQASMYALMRICFTLYGVTLDLAVVGWIIIAIGILSMFTGVTMAVRQTDITRLIAYNCVCEAGFMLVGLGVGLAVLGDMTALRTYGTTAISGAIFHMINHALFEGLLFLVAGAIFYRIGTRDLNQMGGLGHTMKFTAMFFLLGALASSDIPPFNGFASKILIYESVYQFNPILTIIGILVSIITLAVFVKAFFSAFTGASLPKYEDIKEVPKTMIAAMTILAVIIIIFGLFPGLVVDWIVRPATDALLGQTSYINAIVGVIP